ncbi:inorganic triphosphatase [Bradyrhizobium sp. UFLA03-84]|uniref:CYTH and CHAD domain-containing protein n=1 Tax=Bradyrhizobium sp. UFLA03-84 TaxID=418599 RepID=UPI000BAE5A08|nr:CYTH and CHAD domain-containing protein [Bradyrhizobium sp. UFLA03-84]PAY04820.1 inorganic triphosphatase [Bradyrhizobium sp. UFLA03-84]
MNSETELKFRVAARKLSSVLGSGGWLVRDRSERELVSTYYDTTKHKLKRHGLTLRIRKAGDRYMQTVKITGAAVTRGEWEYEVVDNRPDLKKAKNTPLEDLADGTLARKLRPVFRTNIHRTAQTRRVRRSQIEVAVDRGQVGAGRHSRPIAEFELESKSGHLADLFRLARNIERKTGAELDLSSKAERGFQLVAGRSDSAQHAEPIQLEREFTPRDAFRVIGRSTVRQITANSDPVRNMDPEGVHQMRVGLRRLRAAISLFDDVLAHADTARIKLGLKWLTSELAPAREIDVFLRESIRPVAQDAPSRGARAIRKKFSKQRMAAFKRAHNAIDSARYRHLLIDTVEWIESGRSRTTDDRSIAGYAGDVLDRRIRKARKQGKRLNDLDAKQRHKLRINIKKIRYAVDFFRSLYEDADQATLARVSDRLKRIQSALGSLNDFMAHRKLTTEAALTAPPANRRAQAFASGLIVGRERQATHDYMKAATKALHGLHPLDVEPRR